MCDCATATATTLAAPTAASTSAALASASASSTTSCRASACAGVADVASAAEPLPSPSLPRVSATAEPLAASAAFAACVRGVRVSDGLASARTAAVVL